MFRGVGTDSREDPVTATREYLIALARGLREAPFGSDGSIRITIELRDSICCKLYELENDLRLSEISPTSGEDGD